MTKILLVYHVSCVVIDIQMMNWTLLENFDIDENVH